VVVELADTQLSKSCLPKEGVGSTPTHGTQVINFADTKFIKSYNNMNTCERNIPEPSTKPLKPNRHESVLGFFQGQDGINYSTPDAMVKADLEHKGQFNGIIYSRKEQ
jgi:hypothetical protein